MDKEIEDHEVYVDVVNDLMDRTDEHYIIGVTTVQSEDYDGIQSIQIRLAQLPSEGDDQDE